MNIFGEELNGPSFLHLLEKFHLIMCCYAFEGGNTNRYVMPSYCTGSISCHHINGDLLEKEDK